MPLEWIQDANGRWWYRYSDGSYPRNDWKKINNKWYYFDDQGYMCVGWLYHGIDWYYLDPVNGDMKTGWQQINGIYYYFNETVGKEEGKMLTGWILTNGSWYYCDEANGNWIDNTGTQMIQEALKYVGCPYVYGGNSLTKGTDCSGYVKLVSEKFGIITPRTAATQYTSARKISRGELQPGDLVFYHNGQKIYHVGFYVGKITYRGRVYTGAIVNAADETRGICVSDMGNTNYFGTYWR